MIAVLTSAENNETLRDSGGRKVISLLDEGDRVVVSPGRKQMCHRYGIPGKKGALANRITLRTLANWIQDAAVPSHRCPSRNGVFEDSTIRMIDDYFLARWYLGLTVADYWRKVICVDPHSGDPLPSLEKRFLEAFEVRGQFLTPLEKYCLLERCHSLPYLVQLSIRWVNHPESESHPVIVDKFASYQHRLKEKQFASDFQKIEEKLKTYRVASFQFYI